MSKVHSLHSRSTLVRALSLGSLILGIALTSWALLGIQAQTVADAYVGPSPEPTATVAPQVASTETVVVTPRVLYPRRPAEGDKVGSLSIPALKQTFPIIEGTGEDDLKRGVGHFAKSVLPGENDNCVLSGHRDTVFSRLGRLKKGARLVVKTSAGTFTYAVRRIRIVDKDDRTVIVPTGHAVLTVSTCYPFNYVGAAPKRYILVADLVAPQ